MKGTKINKKRPGPFFKKEDKADVAVCYYIFKTLISFAEARQHRAAPLVQFLQPERLAAPPRGCPRRSSGRSRPAPTAPTSRRLTRRASKIANLWYLKCKSPRIKTFGAATAFIRRRHCRQQQRQQRLRRCRRRRQKSVIRLQRTRRRRNRSNEGAKFSTTKKRNSKEIRISGQRPQVNAASKIKNEILTIQDFGKCPLDVVLDFFDVSVVVVPSHGPENTHCRGTTVALLVSR